MLRASYIVEVLVNFNELFIPQHVYATIHLQQNIQTKENAPHSDKLNRMAVARFVQNAESLPPDFKSTAMTNDPDRMG